MKRLKYFVILFAAVLLLPFAVMAEGEEVTATEEAVTEDATSNEVPVYFFRGEGCPHCEEAEQWFSSIEEELGSYFKIVDYETWYNEENADLMQKVAEARGEEAEGVPYIIIGDKSWNGFDEASYADEIKDQIKSVFAQNVNDRYDVMKYLDNPSKAKKEADKSSNNDALILIVILLVCGGAGYGIYKARATAK